MVSVLSCNQQEDLGRTAGTDWPYYGGNVEGNRYSPLEFVNLGNVSRLKPVWTYSTFHDAIPDPQKRSREIQCQPIVVDGIMYGTNADLGLFALNAESGEQLWIFEPENERMRFNTNRGVMYWEYEGEHRILYTAGTYLYAVDASNGELISDFGEDGVVDLRIGLSEKLDHDISKLFVTATSPGIVHKNTLILGSSVSESGDAAPGHIRGYDVLSGKIKWVFRTIPHPGDPGYETWEENAFKTIGGANNWSGMVLDPKRGVVYLGTGSPASDFYGGDRAGANLYANSILALDTETGQLKWYFQTIQHDLWDRDISCPPNLLTIERNGKSIDVVAQATKDGLIYVLERDTGISIFPIEEREVPVNGLPGEEPFPTQKFPLIPRPFSYQELTESLITDISEESREFVKNRLKHLQLPQLKFLPPSEAGTMLFGYSGGAEWGGTAVNPEGVMFVNANNDLWELQMTEVRSGGSTNTITGESIYQANCSSCHGMDQKGNGQEIPSLTTISEKFSQEHFVNILKSGSGRMPSFEHLTASEIDSLLAYVMHPNNLQPTEFSEHSEPEIAMEKVSNGFPYLPRYVNKVWRKVTDQDKYPGVKPPWGTLNAIDLNTGDFLWQVPLGEFPELTLKGIPITGTENYGGPLVTAGGLVFIAATRDEKFRAFDQKTGEIVWEYQLPAGGFATPISYEIKGKQYIALAVGGGRGLKPGGYYIAFSIDN